MKKLREEPSLKKTEKALKVRNFRRGKRLGNVKQIVALDTYGLAEDVDGGLPHIGVKTKEDIIVWI